MLRLSSIDGDYVDIIVVAKSFAALFRESERPGYCGAAGRWCMIVGAGGKDATDDGRSILASMPRTRRSRPQPHLIASNPHRAIARQEQQVYTY